MVKLNCSFFIIKWRKISCEIVQGLLQSDVIITNWHVTGGSKPLLHTRKLSNPCIQNNC